MKYRHSFPTLLISLALLSSCEKAVFDDATTPSTTDEMATLTVSVKGFNIIPFDDTRSGSPIADHCTRLNFVVYQNGAKMKAVNQQSSDADFGQVSMTLPVGSYQVLVLGHSANGNPTLSPAEKIQFTNDDGFTDTFYSYEDVELGTSTVKTEVMLERVTAMFRLITNDNVPDNVERMRLYYTGGSGALDATTGFGCVNSKQVVFFNITDDMRGKPLRLEAYTIPKAQTGTLKVTATAYGANTTVLYEHELTDVPIEVNRITEYRGMFFVTSSGENPQEPPTDGDKQTFSFTVNAEWAGTTTRNY